MNTIKVLIVDDSSIIRSCLIDLLSADEEIEIAGEAENGKEALIAVKELSPDIVIMDINMPVMDGLEAIERIMALKPLPILVFTGEEEAGIAFMALEKGALEVLPKYEISHENSHILIRKIKLISKVRVITHIKTNYQKELIKDSPDDDFEQIKNTKIVAIASSTGGIKALSRILFELPANFPSPIVIAQHISHGFTIEMANWMNEKSRMTIKVAEEGEMIIPGTVYFSKSEKNMTLNINGEIAYVEQKKNDIYHPSCNLLLSSVASRYGNNSVGVILTGMGNDGVKGMEKIKTAGGYTIAQDEHTSVVFGMPQVAIASGCIDKISPLGDIKDEIIHFAFGK